MNGAPMKPGSHPSLQTLALYAGGDLPGFPAFRTRIHVRFCKPCQDEVTRFRLARAELKRATEQELLANCEPITDWKRLEREMTGNITVGLAAARCIERVGRKRMRLLRRAVAAVALIALFVRMANPHSGRTEPPSAGISRADILREEAAWIRRNGLGDDAGWYCSTHTVGKPDDPAPAFCDYFACRRFQPGRQLHRRTDR